MIPSVAAVAFYLLAALAVGAAVMVIRSASAIHSAIWLVLTFLSMAGLYLMLEAEFVAAVQVLVYAGGIMVLFLFVIMLVNLRDVSERRIRVHAAVSGGLGLALAVLVLRLYVRGHLETAVGASKLRAGGNLEAVGQAMFKDALLPFEIASVLLLVAMIGAIVLARPPRA
ncbi:MAG TPA: NADH-quinone oxidoreductase subunit J [Patescibacteria group bacterium]|nr:NADH-quinone oxidoreductase subunit J [Patescibacteria group bacterium]